MMTNPLLEIKYQTQKQLTKEAQYDLVKYVENSRRIVREAEAQYGIKFNYGVREGEGWADDAEELDRYLEWNRQQRKLSRPPIAD